MDAELMSFSNVLPNNDLMTEIWAFDVRELEGVPSVTISKYVIALSQWLVYYKVQINEAKAQKSQLKSDIDFLVSTWMTPELLKEYKTQTAVKEYLIRNNSESSYMYDKIKKIDYDLVKVEGIDKAITELISAFKRELTRRDNELYTTRMERKI
jgi:hypothetical protein